MTARPLTWSVAAAVLVVVVGACAPSQDPRWSRGDGERVVRLAGAAGDADDRFATGGGDDRVAVVDRGSIRERVTVDGVVTIADPEILVAPSGGSVESRRVAVGGEVLAGEEIVVLGSPPDEVVVASPVDGTVGRYLVRTSELVSVGDPLVEVGDSTELILVADLAGTSASLIEIGAVAQVTDPSAVTPRPMAASVVGIRDEVDREVTVEVSLDSLLGDRPGDPPQLGDRLTVSIEVRELTDVLRIAVGAVRSDARGDFVVVDRGDRWERVDILAGAVDGDLLALLLPTDVRVGDRVVIP